MDLIITKEEISEYSSNQATELSDDDLEAVAGVSWGWHQIINLIQDKHPLKII